MTVLVGGVGQLYQGDLDLGRRAAEQLAGEDLGRGVRVEELHYGAVAVVQRLEELRPDTLVLVGAEQRGRPPATVQRRRFEAKDLEPGIVQDAVAQAVTGYVTIDLVLTVGAGFGALPPRTITVEVEPSRLEPSEDLSPQVSEALAVALRLVRAEVRRAPLLQVAAELRALFDGDRLQPAPAAAAMQRLLAELDVLDREGRWGRVFPLREEVRQRIAAGQTGEGMNHLDWALWWAVLEELDRLQPLEGLSPA